MENCSENSENEYSENSEIGIKKLKKNYLFFLVKKGF